MFESGPQRSMKFGPGIETGRIEWSENFCVHLHEELVDDVEICRTSEPRIIMKDLLNVHNMIHIAHVNHLQLLQPLCHQGAPRFSSSRARGRIRTALDSIPLASPRSRNNSRVVSVVIEVSVRLFGVPGTRLSIHVDTGSGGERIGVERRCFG
ncbi:hypothetical protein GQ457_12G023230 [Hibiscus cannabinus]